MPEDSVPIKVILADDRPVSRRGTRSVLCETPDIDIIAEAENGEEALRLTRVRQPDVLVAEMDLPDLPGIQLATRLREARLPTRMLAFSAYLKERYARRLMETGLAGYLTKRAAPEQLVQAIRKVAAGEDPWLSPQVAAYAVELQDRTDGVSLLDEHNVTEREREVGCERMKVCRYGTANGRR